MVALGWFAASEVHDFGETAETFMGDFDAMFGGGEDCRFFRGDLAGLAIQYQAGAAFGAGMLREQDNTRVGALGGCAVAEPRGEGDAQGEFRGDGAHVEHDGAESSSLKEEVGDAEGLIEARP